MADVRSELWRLVGEVQDCGCDVTDVVKMNYVENDVLIDHLIAAGVVIPVRCKDCKHFDEYFGKCYVFRHDNIEVQLEVESDHFCSYGERREE